MVQLAPRFYALLGLIWAGWVSWPWAHEQAAYPAHRDLWPEYRRRVLNIRPAATTWLDLGDTADIARVTEPAAAASSIGTVLALKHQGAAS
jgi:hypothetical protein